MTFADITKISKDLKWYPKINISEGVNLILKNIQKLYTLSNAAKMFMLYMVVIILFLQIQEVLVIDMM